MPRTSAHSVVPYALAALLACSGCDDSSTPKESNENGASGAVHPLLKDYPELCSYTVENEAGKPIVRGEFERSARGDLESFEIQNLTDGEVSETYTYTLEESPPDKLVFTEVTRYASDENPSRNKLVIEPISGHNLAVLSSGPTLDALRENHVAVYDQSPLELLAAGASFPIGKRVDTDLYSFDEDGRLTEAQFDRNGGGDSEGRVHIAYAGEHLNQLQLGRNDTVAKYLETEYADGRLTGLRIDVNMDGTPDEILTPTYKCGD